jgi:hypothetical protein
MKRRQVNETTLGIINGISINPRKIVRPLNFEFPINAHASPSKYEIMTVKITNTIVTDKEDKKSDFME